MLHSLKDFKAIYDYQGDATCAADGMCQEKCPVKINTGELIKHIDDLASRVANIWISFDLDVIDQLYAPGAGMPNPKGLTYREIALIAEYIGKHGHVIGIDVVEYNPLIDQHGQTAELGIELIARFLGHDYSWYANYMAQNQL